MAELPEWFPNSMEEMYRLNPGERPSLLDPRVASSHGGGMMPVQHWGVLTDGRVFYFRYRHGSASVALGPSWYEGHLLPARDQRVSMEQWDAAWAVALKAVGGEAENVPSNALPNLWLEPRVGVMVTEEDNGWFDTQEELDSAFKVCLDLAWDLPFDDEGWEYLRQTNWRKE